MNVLMAAALLVTSAASVPGFQSEETIECALEAQLVQVPEAPEASGVAVSQRTPGRLWVHNDSGEPVLIAVDARGAVTGRLRLDGARVEDWEALAIAPCEAGSCLYVADIGDNDAERRRVTIYRVPEPAGADATADVKDVFHAVYPDGAHDAEALLVTPDGSVAIVTKGETGPVALYKFPAATRSGETHTLEHVGTPRGASARARNDRITDGAISPDGTWAVLRSNGSLTVHRTADLLGGNWREVRRIDLGALGEPQGEGVAIGSDGSLYLAGEGGGRKRPGTLARLECSGLASR